MKKGVLLINLISIACIGFGQEVTGTIISELGEPIPYASIYFDGTTIGTTSKTDGTFLIKMPHDTSMPLIVSFIGFETIFITNYVSQHKALTIQLTPSSQQLDEIVLELDIWSRKKNYVNLKIAFLAPTLLP